MEWKTIVIIILGTILVALAIGIDLSGVLEGHWECTKEIDDPNGIQYIDNASIHCDESGACGGRVITPQMCTQHTWVK